MEIFSPYTKMILQIHDELVFEFDESEMDRLIPDIKYIMENITSLSVKLRCDCEFGENWENLSDWQN